MPIPTVQRIANVSFTDHFLGAEKSAPVNGQITVNRNTFDVRFVDGRVRAKFTTGNAFSNFFRSRTLARFTRTLQDQYNAWTREQAEIEHAKAVEFAQTLGFKDNPDTAKAADVIKEFTDIVKEANPAGKNTMLQRLDDLRKLTELRNTLTRVSTGAECNKIVSKAGFATHFKDFTTGMDEKGKKGYVLRMIDNIIGCVIESAAKMEDKKTQVLDFLLVFDGVCLEAKTESIQTWLARANGIIKAAHSDSSNDLAYSITAEFKEIADKVTEPFLEEARKACEDEVRAKCREKNITDEADIKRRIESKAQMLILEKDDEIKGKIREELEYDGKFALYEVLAGAKRPVTEISRNPETGKWVITTLVDKTGAPVLKPVSAFDIDRNFSKMVDMFMEDAIAMANVERKTVVEEPVFATRLDYLAQGVLDAADGYVSGNANVAELTKRVRAELCFKTDLTDEELELKVREALGEIAGTKADDPAQTAKQFANFVNTYADGSYFDERNDHARLVNLVVRRTEALVDLKKTCEAKIEEVSARCAQMIRNFFPRKEVWVHTLKDYIEQTLRQILKSNFKDDDQNAHIKNAKIAFKSLMPNGVFATDNPLFELGHRAAGGVEARLQTYVKYIMQCVQHFFGKSPQMYIRPRQG